jgi:dienelactone hydrolase
VRRLLESLGLKRRKKAWAEAARYTIRVGSTLDGACQPCVLVPSREPGPRPLLVYLHPWRHGYDFDASGWREEAVARGWHFLAPHFRGPNRTSKSCASRWARQDVLDAVNWVSANHAVDTRRVYAGGVSGGGHMTLAMAAEAPDRWAAVSAWCPISDLAAFYDECIKTDARAHRHIVRIAGGAPGSSPSVDVELRYRSPRYHLARAKDLPIDINHGIDDGCPKGIGVQHSLWAFNTLAYAHGVAGINDAELKLLRDRKVVDSLGLDSDYGRALFLRRQAGPARVTIFEGGHEDLPRAACGWLAGHARE